VPNIVSWSVRLIAVEVLINLVKEIVTVKVDSFPFDVSSMVYLEIFAVCIFHFCSGLVFLWAILTLLSRMCDNIFKHIL